MPKIQSLISPSEIIQSNVPPPVPDPTVKPFRFVCCGASGSGKTTVLMNCLLFFWKDGEMSLFDKIYIFTPSALQDPIWKVLIKDKDVASKTELRDSIDEELLYQLINDENNQHERRLIWIDDMASNKKMMGRYIWYIYLIPLPLKFL